MRCVSFHFRSKLTYCQSARTEEEKKKPQWRRQRRQTEETLLCWSPAAAVMRPRERRQRWIECRTASKLAHSVFEERPRFISRVSGSKFNYSKWRKVIQWLVTADRKPFLFFICLTAASGDNINQRAAFMGQLPQLFTSRHGQLW